jgi:hypothetical protein
MDSLIEKLPQIILFVFYCVAALLLMVVAWYASRLFRANLSKTELRPIDYLESFRKMREEGKLTEEEFRIIRTLVSLQISRSHDESKSDYSLLNK